MTTTERKMKDMIAGEFERILANTPKPKTGEGGKHIAVKRLFSLGSKELMDPHSQIELKMSLRVKDLCFEFANALYECGEGELMDTPPPEMPVEVEMPISMSMHGVHLQFFRFYNHKIDAMLARLVISGHVK